MKHTKQIVVVILVVVMSFIAALTLLACGKDMYGGKFSEVTEEVKVNQLLEDVQSISNEESWENFKANITLNEEDFSFKLTILSSGTPLSNGYKQSMELSLKGSGQNISTNIYYLDGDFYLNIKGGGISQRIKVPGIGGFDSIKAIINGIFVTAMGNTNIDLNNVDLSIFNLQFAVDGINELLKESNIKIFQTAETGARNIKISTEFENLYGYFIIALDADNNLKGIKMENNAAGSLMTFSIEQFSGSIKFPGDLNKYFDPSDIDLTDLTDLLK